MAIKQEDWIQRKWRPMMAIMYMVVCTLDMAVFPVLWSLLQVFTHEPITQWQPLTLQGAGLFHLAMGAVLGIAAWGRTQEKVAGVNVTAAPQPESVLTTTAGFNGTSFGPPPIKFINGKPAPQSGYQPEL